MLRHTVSVGVSWMATWRHFEVFCVITAAIGARKPNTAARHNDAFINRDHSMSAAFLSRLSIDLIRLHSWHHTKKIYSCFCCCLALSFLLFLCGSDWALVAIFARVIVSQFLVHRNGDWLLLKLLTIYTSRSAKPKSTQPFIPPGWLGLWREVFIRVGDR